MPQLVAGYILESVARTLERKENNQEFRSLLRRLSTFDLSGSHSGEVMRASYLDAIRNMIERGMPTRPSLELEEKILQKIGLGTSCKSELGSYFWDLEIPGSIAGLLWRAFHTIEPRMGTDHPHFQLDPDKNGSNLENKFFYEFLKYFDGAYKNILQQNLIWQRKLTSIIPQSTYKEQLVDFSYEFPYKVEGKQGIIIEVNGGQHNRPLQQNLDLNRELAAANQNWETLPISQEYFSKSAQTDSKWKEIKAELICYLGSFGKILALNSREPLFLSKHGQNALQLALTPIAIARIQRTILQYIGCPGLEMDAPFWEITVFERDVPCADLAIWDLKEIFKHLNILTEGAVPKLPQIKLTIWKTAEFSDVESKNSLLTDLEEFQITQSIPIDIPCDLLIDISTLLQPEVIITASSFRNVKNYAIIRNSPYSETARRVHTNIHIPYGTFTYLKDNNESSRVEDTTMVESLRFFLRWFFRKVDFRIGQLPILQRALKGESVIALLPTGGGKSLTYQLAALMQPGVSLIIDPIKSLMKDQLRGLTSHWIDFSVMINSNLSRNEKTLNQSKIKNGEVLFAFISPERLQMQEFRNVIANMLANQIYFAYCVIDEAHCVSEWGHDFRTSYLQLGKNAMNFCKTKNELPIPLFGLTATASFDVLADIQRELSEEKNPLREDAIIRYESTKRDELFYRFVNAKSTKDSFSSFADYRNSIGEAKQQTIIEIIANNILSDLKDAASKSRVDEGIRKLEDAEILKFLRGTGEGGVIVFCPHKTGPFGVKNILPKIQTACPSAQVGYFIGADSQDALQAVKDQEQSDESQDKFLKNELDLLVATKAFGMGIDKPNIRTTIHINYPGSLESFMQESGRAGRDRKPALCYVVLNDKTFNRSNIDKENNLFFFNKSFKGADKELENISELLNQIYFPDQKGVLEGELEAELDLPLQISTWTSVTGNNYISIQEDFEHRIGDIGCWADYPCYPKDNYPNSREILQHCKTLLLKKAGNLHLWEFLKTPAKETREGIIPRLSKLKPNAPYSLQFYFSNNKSERVQKITTWLKRVIDPTKFDEANVYTKIRNANNFDEFILDLGKIIQDQDKIPVTASLLDAKRGHPNGTSLGNFRNLYNGFRDKQDTEKAIYRLFLLGIIDDYTIDYKTGTISISGRQKTDTEYRDSLRHYIQKYYSEARAKIIMNKLPKINNNPISNIEQYAKLLVEFIYQAVAEKRRQAIDDIEIAIRIGIEKGNNEFKDYVDLYFNSKYSRRDYKIQGKPYSLFVDTDRRANIETIWKYIQATEIDTSGSELENIKHLRGACIKLLGSYPDNFVLLILEAFCIWRLEYSNPKFYPDIEEKIRKGLENLQIETNFNDAKLEVFYLKFKEQIFKNQQVIKSHFNPEFGDIMLNSYLEIIIGARKYLQKLNKRISYG